MIRLLLLFNLFIFFGHNLIAQTDFPILKQQFLDYRKADKQDSALLVARKLNKLALSEQTDTSYWYALSLRYIGNPYEAVGNNDSTLYYWLKSLDYFEKYHQNSDDHATGNSSLGIYYKKQGLYKMAENYYKAAATIRSKSGTMNSSYASTLNNLSYLYNSMGLYDKAMELVDSSINIYSNLHSSDSTFFIAELNSKAEILMNIGEYDNAEKLYQYCIEYCNKMDCSFLRKMRFSKDLAELYLKQGKYTLAETNLLILDSLLTIKVKNYELYQLLGEIKYSQGKIKSIKGQFNAAQDYYNESLSIRRMNLPKNHPDIAESLNSFGVLNAKLGEYELAHSYYEEALNIRKVALGENHPDYAESLNSLGSLNIDLGDYKLAESLQLAALEIRKNSLGEEHPSYAINLSTLGRLYRLLEQFNKSEEYFKRSLEIRLKIHKIENHENVLSSMNSLGYLYFVMGRYKESEHYLSEVHRIRKESLMDENQNCALNLYNLGILYYELEKYKSAEEFLSKSIEIRKILFNEFHAELISSQLALSKIFLKTNRFDEAFSMLDFIFRNKLANITKSFEWLSESQKELYWKKEQGFYEQISWLSNNNYSTYPKFASLNYDAALVSKSKMLEAKISNENYYRDVDELREELAYRRKLLAKMESDGSTQKETLAKLDHEADSLDKRLTQSWPEYALQKKNLSITWDQVQQNLENGEAAIEFVRFKNEDDSLFYYNALVLQKGAVTPILVKLCKEIELQAISPKLGFSAYYPLLWQPLEASLKDVKIIYYAPTGELNNVPFHAIYAPSGKGNVITQAKTEKRGVLIKSEQATTEQNAVYLMDRYTLHELTSTRYLAMGLKEKAKEPIGTNLAMVGGVNYEFLPGSTSTPKKNKKNKNEARSNASSSGNLAYLEGTKIEVAQINQQATTATWRTKLIESNNATEENLTYLEGKHAKSIIHIATHGYAFPEYDFKDTSINKNSLRYSYRYSNNPMVRSGLILAGGNWAWTGSDTLSKLGAEQNGILTALEVSQLNLKKTKLVVLSACETGLGKIEGSEGTFGLKRGFKLAGVEQIIVSLWSVPDKETMELMTLFYTDLTKTLNPVISFSNAQKEMRNKYPTEPEKWAGFVLVR